MGLDTFLTKGVVGWLGGRVVWEEKLRSKLPQLPKLKFKLKVKLSLVICASSALKTAKIFINTMLITMRSQVDKFDKKCRMAYCDVFLTIALLHNHYLISNSETN